MRPLDPQEEWAWKMLEHLLQRLLEAEVALALFLGNVTLRLADCGYDGLVCLFHGPQT